VRRARCRALRAICTHGICVGGGEPDANVWDGVFPLVDGGKDGFEGIAPAAFYVANAFWLYGMIGNVWKWTATCTGGPTAFAIASHLLGISQVRSRAPDALNL
jgi:Sulfatase-modifying factor enzyme 1